MAFRTYTDAEIATLCGLSDLYVAPITTDSISAYTPGTPTKLAPIAEVAVAPDAQQVKTYYDNGARNIIVSATGAELTLQIAGLDPEALADIMGWEYDSTTGLVLASTQDQPGYFALAFKERIIGPDNSYDYNYWWWLKGQFRPSDSTTATQGETIDPRSMQLVYSAVETIYQFSYPSAETRGGLFTMASSVDTNATAMIASWFTAVVTPDTAGS